MSVRVLLLTLALGSALAWGQGTVTLSWSWEVQGAGSCSAAGDTSVGCQLSAGTTASVILSVTASPARPVNLAPVALPVGWPPAPASSGWGTARALYTFALPAESAGRQVEIVYRAWAEGISPLDLRLAIEIKAPTSSCAPLPASPHQDGRILWSRDRPITWSDFWAPPPPGRDPAAVAGIATALEYRLTPAVERFGGGWQARVAALTVTAAMERNLSWAVPDRRTPAGLLHEQRHFDLVELYRRLLERSLRELAASGPSPDAALHNLLAAGEAVFRAVSERHSQAQALYDRETDHGRNTARQAEWDRKIAAWLLDPTPPLP